MGTITEDLAALLGTVERPGSFHASGREAILAPGLEVDGLGPIALPLLPTQAEELVALAEQAPYGRGQETLVDTSVRRCWQISADKVQLRSRHWPATLERIAARVAEGLGVTESIDVELYKLLIYDAGGFFVPHRDTEKAEGMFATLVISLPSFHEGGALIVRHQGQEVRLDLRCTDPAEAAFAAFYADCLHEVEPVTEGKRLVLIYNLLRRGKGSRPLPPDHRQDVARLAERLQAWNAAIASGEEEVNKVVYPLEHVYTSAGLSFADLKGADAARAETLRAAAAAGGCELHLALLSIEESGPAEVTSSYSPRYSRYGQYKEDDADDYEMVDVSDCDIRLTDWRHPDGNVFPLAFLQAEDEEFSPPDVFDDEEPDEKRVMEATGNAGASLERLYRRTALVLWPQQQRSAVLATAGPDAILPLIKSLASQWVEEGAQADSASWQEAHALAAHLLPSLINEAKAYYPGSSHWDHVSQMLKVLARLQDRELIEALTAKLAGPGQFGIDNVEALLAALALLPLPKAMAFVTAVVKGNAASNVCACSRLLAATVADDTFAPDPSSLRPAAQALRTALAGNQTSREEPEDKDGWFQQRRPFSQSITPAAIVDSLTALGAIDPLLADDAATLMLASPQRFGPDAMLIPALKRLAAQPSTWPLSATQRLREHCLNHLQKRMAEDLSPPADWRREANLSCDCLDCLNLSRFLVDSQADTWQLKAAQHRRSHVETVIRNSKCDVSCTTVRKSSPHSLVCTKTQASYEQRVRQRQQDQESKLALEAMDPEIRREGRES